MAAVAAPHSARDRTLHYVAMLCLIAFVLYGAPAGFEWLRGNPVPREMGGSWADAPIIQKDSLGYLAVSKDLRDGQLDELHLRTWGYPLLLLATGSGEIPTRFLFFASLALHLLCIWLLAWLLRESRVHAGLMWLFVVLLLLPPFVEPAVFVMTETLTSFLMVVGVVGTAFGIVRRKKWWLVLAGVGWAYAGLVHPTFQALSLFVVGCLVVSWFAVPWMQLQRRTLATSSLIFVALFGLLIGGALLKNRVSFGYVGLTPFTGLALSTKTVRVVEQLPEEYAAVRGALVAARDADLIAPGSSHMALSYIWRAHDEISQITGLKGVELSQYLVKLNLTLIKAAPLSYLQEVFLTAAAFWSPSSGQGVASMGSNLAHGFWALLDLGLIILFFAQLLLVGGGTILARVRRLVAAPATPDTLGGRWLQLRALGYTLALSAVAYTTLINAFFGPGMTRYRAPVMPLVIFLCMIGLDAAWRLLRPAKPL